MKGQISLRLTDLIDQAWQATRPNGGALQLGVVAAGVLQDAIDWNHPALQPDQINRKRKRDSNDILPSASLDVGAVL